LIEPIFRVERKIKRKGSHVPKKLSNIFKLLSIIAATTYPLPTPPPQGGMVSLPAPPSIGTACPSVGRVGGDLILFNAFALVEV